MSGYDKRNRNVLRRCLNIAGDGAGVMCDGRLFQKLTPETGKARLPTVEKLNLAGIKRHCSHVNLLV